jgi:hypothetical protein
MSEPTIGMPSEMLNVIAVYQIHQAGETNHQQRVAKSKLSHWFASAYQITGERLSRATDRLKLGQAGLANLLLIFDLSDVLPTSDFYGFMTVLLRFGVGVPGSRIHFLNCLHRQPRHLRPLSKATRLFGNLL